MTKAPGREAIASGSTPIPEVTKNNGTSMPKAMPSILLSSR